MAFYRGQLVECVEYLPHPVYSTELRVGGKYRVAKSFTGQSGRELLHLCGIPVPDGNPGSGFFSGHFRPVVEPKTDLPESITKYLDSKNHHPLPEDVPGIVSFV